MTTNRNWRPSPGKPRSANRIPIILEAMKTEWEKHPDMRLGQLISNICSDHIGCYGPLFQVEDDTFFDELKHWSEKHD